MTVIDNGEAPEAPGETPIRRGRSGSATRGSASGLVLFLFSGSSPAGLPAVADCTVTSGPSKVALVELYTSEGCSSCPVADRWFSGLEAVGFGAAHVIPLGFHVDYWDSSGWRDRFSNPLFSARQREKAGASGVVYTPQIRIDGRDFPDWRRPGAFAERIAQANRHPAKAIIALGAVPSLDGILVIEANVQIPNPGDRAEARLYLAVAESHLETNVRTGENGGATLRHDHVARELLGPYLPDRSGFLSLVVRVPVERSWKKADLAVVGFMENGANGEILQAVATRPCAE